MVEQPVGMDADIPEATVTANAIALQLVWVAAHHGLRRHWRAVHDITDALGGPPAPGGPR